MITIRDLLMKRSVENLTFFSSFFHYYKVRKVNVNSALDKIRMKVVTPRVSLLWVRILWLKTRQNYLTAAPGVEKFRYRNAAVPWLDRNFFLRMCRAKYRYSHWNLHSTSPTELTLLINFFLRFFIPLIKFQITNFNVNFFFSAKMKVI